MKSEAMELFEKKILFVNDAQLILHGAQLMLSDAGYNNVGTDDGANALRMLKRGRYDLLIQDLQRPVMDGFELYYRVKKQDKLRNIPIILLTLAEPSHISDSKKIIVGTHIFEGLIRADFDYPEDVLGSIPRYLKSPVPFYIEGYVNMMNAMSLLLPLMKSVLDARSHIKDPEGEFKRRNKVLWPAVIKALADPRIRPTAVYVTQPAGHAARRPAGDGGRGRS